MITVHKDSIKRSDASRLVNICVRTKPIIIDKCPLCISKPSEEGTDPDTLLDHVADHIYDFSLSSLPSADGPPQIITGEEIKTVVRKVKRWLDIKDDEKNTDCQNEILQSTMDLSIYFCRKPWDFLFDFGRQSSDFF
jgi:hypothetical protein